LRFWNNMDFFNSLPIDLKILVVAIIGSALLAFLSGNAKSEKRYVLLLALLTAGAVYRFNQPWGHEQAEVRAAARPAPRAVTQAPTHVPLVSTAERPPAK
jgi:hypothetical protein